MSRLRREVEALRARRGWGSEAERRKRREEEREKVREQAERANEGHLRTVASVRRSELIREAGGREGLDLSEGAVLDGGEEVPFTIGKDGSVACTRDGRPVTDGRHVWAEEAWWMQAAWEALTLVRGSEPGFTLHEDGVLRTPGDGRHVLSRGWYDTRNHFGPQTSRQHEEMAERPERWDEFLAADDEAADALDKLREIPEDLDAPRGFVTPISDDHTEEEVESFAGTMKPYPLFSDAEEREAVRRLAWALLYDPGARALFSDLTLRRDAFAAS
jgi:hypothetical protein